MPFVCEPSQSLFLHDDEARYFQVFCARADAELSGCFGSSFWTRRVLQECHSEKAIRRVAVALGALYTARECAGRLAPTLPSSSRASRAARARSHWEAAFHQYGQALKAARLLPGQSVRSYQTRLMASILFACFDSFVGAPEYAIQQIQNGLRLLGELQSQSPGSGHCSPGFGHVEEDLVVVLTRLVIQAKSYDMAFHFPQPNVIRLEAPTQTAHGSPACPRGAPPALPWPPLSLPRRFASLEDARTASDRLCEMLVRFIERLQANKNKDLGSALALGNVLPASWERLGEGFQHELDSWSAAFEPIFGARADASISHRQRSAIATLKMFQMNIEIIFLMMFCATEMQFDAYMSHFGAIVRLGWEVLEADTQRAAAEHSPGASPPHHVRPTFSADMGIVPPLFVVATKCRHPGLRRQAIQILRSSARREGMWDSELAARIGQWIMEVEEHGEQLSPGGALARSIPEERRVTVQTVKFSLCNRWVSLSVGSRVPCEGSRDHRLRRARIVW